MQTQLLTQQIATLEKLITHSLVVINTQAFLSSANQLQVVIPFSVSLFAKLQKMTRTVKSFFTTHKKQKSLWLFSQVKLFQLLLAVFSPLQQQLTMALLPLVVALSFLLVLAEQ